MPRGRHEAISMADVFISYSKSHIELTRSLANELEAKDVTVWWDTDLIAGESFRGRIMQEIKACKAAIVIWTRDSVQSDYVLSEAERARMAGKLIQLRTADLDPSELPPPFDTMHASLVQDRKAIYAALARLGVLGGDSGRPTELRSPFSRHSLPTRGKSLLGGKLVLAALAGLIAIGVLVTMISFRADIGPTFQSVESGATSVAQRFLDELNTGLRDSSLFEADVRLSRRGLLSRVEAVSELRKLWSRYSQVNCRMGGSGVTLKDPQHARNGFRAQIDTECDLTDLAGVATTRRFPLEIEAAPDPRGRYLISGLWHAEEMWLWQPRGRD
jgi:hypothetical protein